MCKKDRSNTGCFCPEKCGCPKSDFTKDVGTGVTLYFKTMKQLILFFFVCTVLSMPQFICLFKSDSNLRTPEFGADYMLGSLGWNIEIFGNTTQSDGFNLALNCSEHNSDSVKFVLEELLIV